MKKGIWIIVILLGSAIALFNVESIQKPVYDKKADLTGTRRIAYVYHPFDSSVVRTYEDTDMRFDRDGNGWVLWLGSVNKKIVVNPTFGVIVEDQ